jgi:hypothetical protein
MVFNCLYKFAMFGSVSIKLEQFTGIIVNHLTGTSSTCGLPKVLKAERSTGLVIHLENLDPGIKINKCNAELTSTGKVLKMHARQ